MDEMTTPELAPVERFTYRHYKTWPEAERWELIEGQAWGMSPAPMRQHQDISKKLEKALELFLSEKPCRMYHAPFDVLLPEMNEADDSVDTIVQPDIMVFCDLSKLTKAGARGAPDWVIEILSPSTAKKDLNEKFRLYERHGVREYWAVDPDARAIHAWKLEENGRFGKEWLCAKGEALSSSALEGFAVDSQELFKELD
jgi:Uma2 family endonuclease